MNKNKEAYQYGKRLGKEAKNKPNGKQFLKNASFQWGKVKAMLRELSGYEDNKHYSNLNPQGYQSDSFRIETKNSETTLKNEVIPSFRKGFYEGIN
jgi:hypothetical protein